MSQTVTQAPTAPEGFFEDLHARALSPGWAKKAPQMWPTPRPRFVPAVWRYADARAALDAACAFVSPEQAERRNLIMVDPIADNIYPTCRNLVAAYQLVLPGETARSHRHSPNALRLILDAGERTFTIVNGVRIDVAPGDVVLTPSWHWHGHSNFGDEPAFWIDFLDVPFVQNLECMFFEDYPQRNEPVTGHEPDSPMRHKRADLERDHRRAVDRTDAGRAARTASAHRQQHLHRLERQCAHDGRTTRHCRTDARRRHCHSLLARIQHRKPVQTVAVDSRERRAGDARTRLSRRDHALT
jgi:gentisate 1,2-dioxygenase